jgi:hypothetical protein
LNLSFLQKKTKINKKRIKMMTIFSKSLTFQVLWHSAALGSESLSQEFGLSESDHPTIHVC